MQDLAKESGDRKSVSPSADASLVSRQPPIPYGASYPLGHRAERGYEAVADNFRSMSPPPGAFGRDISFFSQEYRYLVFSSPIVPLFFSSPIVPMFRSCPVTLNYSAPTLRVRTSKPVAGGHLSHRVEEY